jgi:outer membrane protein assembly factor BamA
VPEQTSLRSYQLTRVEFTGLRRVPRSHALAQTGLRPNTLVTQRDLEAASARLLDSGLFLSIRNQYRMEGYGLVVTFVVEEDAWATPVCFDNFVGYSDDQLARAIAARLPLFDGHAPQSAVILGRITAALQDLVRRTAPGATVSYVLAADWRGENRRYRFSMAVPGRRTPICAIDVEGLAGDQLTEARAKSASLLGAEFSRDFVEQHASRNILPICRREGRYLARVSGVSVRAGPSAEQCADGVHVTITFTPGSRYSWGPIDWVGPGAIKVEELSPLLQIAAGQPADEDRLNDGLEAIATEYRRRGYFAATVRSVRAVDEAKASVACRVAVFEGNRFRFRNLELVGFAPDVTSRMRELWALPSGEFYDGRFTKQFMTDIRQFEAAALEGRTLVTRERPDAATTTVDVIIEVGKTSGSFRADHTSIIRCVIGRNDPPHFTPRGAG